MVPFLPLQQHETACFPPRSHTISFQSFWGHKPWGYYSLPCSQTPLFQIKKALPPSKGERAYLPWYHLNLHMNYVHTQDLTPSSVPAYQQSFSQTTPKLPSLLDSKGFHQPPFSLHSSGAGTPLLHSLCGIKFGADERGRTSTPCGTGS